MSYTKFLSVVLFLSGSVLSFTALQAGEPCAHCGCACPCQKTCRLVCEEKKVTVTCWGCQSEDFCLGTPSKRGCEHCEEVCAECADKNGGVQSAPKPFIWFDWCPGDAKMFTKKKLMKKTITKTVPSYKWVVEDLCAKCQEEHPSVTPPPDAKIPPPPLPVPTK